MQELTASCDLWVLPSPRYSHWLSRLDWYLNWQICKGLAYGGLHLPAELYRISEEYGVAVPSRPNHRWKQAPCSSLLKVASRRPDAPSSRGRPT
ncbi:MAG: hypothetical protein HC902_10270 [Calothrix sp. SM1_5_4]|nr:hypothetical protein [Calothrix sp. SM1_5_4]